MDGVGGLQSNCDAGSTYPRQERAPDSSLLNGHGAAPSGPNDDEFRHIVENLPAAVYTTDASGRITFFNDAAAAMWGRRPKLGEDWWCGSWRLYWPDGRPMAHDECPMAMTLKTGRAVRGAEAVAERPDGTRVPFIPFPKPLHDASGRLIGAVNMLIDISDRKRAEEAGHRLVAIVESSDDAIVSKDLNGIIASWNKGAERIFGYAAEEVIGKPVTILIPPVRRDEEQQILERIRRGEPVEHFETVRQHKDGRLVDISLTVSPVRDTQGSIIGASKIARDITDRKQAERKIREQTRRFETLNRISRILSSELDLGRVVQTVTDIATELSGAKFGAFFYNVIDDKGGSSVLHALAGATRDAFEKFGLPRNSALFEPTVRGAAIVRSDDIRIDARYGKNAPHYEAPDGDLPVVSYLAVPVVSRSGEILGGLFFGHDQAGIFTAESEELVQGIAAHAAIAIDNARLHQAAQAEIEQRRRAEETKELLLSEIKHRVKNTLGTVQAIASQTFRQAPRDERDSFVARLRALADAHDLLTDRNWDGAAVGDVVQRALAPFEERHRERFRVSGPDAWLNASKSLLLAMGLHELATNAVKYGALSNGSGVVSVAWELVRRHAAERPQARLAGIGRAPRRTAAT